MSSSSFIYVALKGKKKLLHYQIGHTFPRHNSKIEKPAEKFLPFPEQLNGRTVEESLVSEEKDLIYMTVWFSYVVVSRKRIYGCKQMFCI